MLVLPNRSSANAYRSSFGALPANGSAITCARGSTIVVTELDNNIFEKVHAIVNLSCPLAAVSAYLQSPDFKSDWTSAHLPSRQYERALRPLLALLTRVIPVR